MYFQSPLIAILSLTATATAALTTCAADNCYRALFPCSSSLAWSTATSYCATITASGTTATNYPTRATSACGTAPARYLSACACGPTCTPTVCPPLGLVPNGDFECNLASWTVQTPDTSVSTSITSNANTGTKAFNVHLNFGPATPELGVSARISSASIPVAVGKPLRLTFATFFDNGDAGFIGVMVNGVPVRTVDARDLPLGVWNGNSVDITPSAASLVIRFEFLFSPANSAALGSNMAVDTVRLETLA